VLGSAGLDPTRRIQLTRERPLTEIAPITDGELISVDDEPQLSLWDEVRSRRDEEAFRFNRRTLATRESEFNKYALIGVPFVITKLVFQPVPTNIEDEGVGYVSCEATIFPFDMVDANARRGLIPGCPTAAAWTESYKVLPEEEIVFNDGGKGIRRELIELLYNARMISVPRPTDTKRDFDVPWTEWTEYCQSETREVGEGNLLEIPMFDKVLSGKRLLITAERGLRASKDPLAPKGHSDTFFLS
jgi:hypothetical protein